MKTFRHPWRDEEFLLHLQLNNASPAVGFTATVRHRLTDGRELVEPYEVGDGQPSFRFMVSRAHPLETETVVEYPDAVTLEAYRLEDRAYYPIDAFFVG